jgi:hypothetical protein
LRKGSSAAENKPRRIQSFVTSNTPSSVLKTLIRFAQQSGYKIEFLDEAKGNIVLSDGASLTSYGFFYPVFLTSERESQTLVEVGIKSKVWQVGPIVSRRHDKCFNSVKAAILVAS